MRGGEVHLGWSLTTVCKGPSPFEPFHMATFCSTCLKWFQRVGVPCIPRWSPSKMDCSPSSYATNSNPSHYLVPLLPLFAFPRIGNREQKQMVSIEHCPVSLREGQIHSFICKLVLTMTAVASSKQHWKTPKMSPWCGFRPNFPSENGCTNQPTSLLYKTLLNVFLEQTLWHSAKDINTPRRV